MLLLTIAACGTNDPDPSVMAPVSGFAGFAVADEPQAAQIGERILSRNGSAADAAVAMALSMSVTLPSRAGLGGGGVCLISTPEARVAEVYDFLPQSLPSGGVVPATVRGLALLHARHGSLRWPLLVAPAEQQARFGFAMSRALMSDIEAAGGIDPQLAEGLFGRRLDGVEVGDTLSRPQLSTLLAGLRQRGPNYLYSGEVVRRFADASEDIGRAVDANALRDYRPLEGTAREAGSGDLRVFMPTTAASETAAARLSGETNAAPVPAGGGAAGLVVGDRRGTMVTCTLTQGAPFGSGEVVPGTGLVMADPTAAGGDSLVPAVLRNRFTGRNIGVVSAVGDDTIDALVQTALDVDAGRQDIPLRLSTLRSSGASGRISLLICPGGLAEGPGNCMAVSDPAGHGLTVRAQ